ncbi:MAG: BatD family protein [Elusimicrobia bacterium]|nr:BatD family protein [Elusimicrobiota bacterium]
MKALLALMLLSAPARAAVSINASVNKTTVALNDQIVLTVTVSADASSLPEPEMPSLPRFNVHSAGRSQSMTFINGRISNSAEYTFVLVPRLIGNAVIGPIGAHAGSQNAQTEPIAVTIVRPEEAPQQPAQPAAPAAGPPGRPQRGARTGGGAAPVFVTAEVDKKNPFVNEQVVYTVRFHYAVPLLGNAEWAPPNTTGMLSEDLPPSGHQTASIQGRTYNVSEVKIALFPLTPGEKTIGKGSIRCQVQKGVEVDPFASDFFRQFFSAGLTMGEPVTLETSPITLSVRALPEAGKPPGFGGAVGRFKAKAVVDNASVKAGDAVNLTYTVEGSGNLKALADPSLPDMPEFRVYETVSSLNQTKDGTGVRGSKVYRTVVVPKVSGDLTIPAVQFHYFDPAQQRFVSAATDPIVLQVAPGEAAQAPVGFSAAGQASATAITTLSEDIRHVRSRPGADAVRAAAAAVAGAGWLHALPAALLVLSGAFAAWRDRYEQDPVRARARRAGRAAEERLTRSRSAKGLHESSALVGEALVVYLADRLALPPSGLTMRQALEQMRKRWPALPEGHIEQVRRLWAEMERIRYAPTTVRDADVAQLRDAVHELLKALEEATGR